LPTHFSRSLEKLAAPRFPTVLNTARLRQSVLNAILLAGMREGMDAVDPRLAAGSPEGLSFRFLY
jgi:hypothetical protein